MFTRTKNLFKWLGTMLKRIWRPLWIALAGQGIFLISVFTMSPLRMWEDPVVNYNLYYVPALAIVLGYLFYRCCTEENESRGYLFGFFAALFASLTGYLVAELFFDIQYSLSLDIWAFSIGSAVGLITIIGTLFISRSFSTSPMRLLRS